VFLLFSRTLFEPGGRQTTVPSGIELTTPCEALLLPNKEYYPYLKNYFRKAEKSIVGTVYLVKTANYPDNEPADLLRELIAAKKRNVEVNLVVDISNDDRDASEANMQAAELLRKAGIPVRFDTASVATHSKTFVIDDRYCFLGSHNLTHAAMSRNAELSIFLDSPEMARKITEFVLRIPVSSQTN